MDLVAPPAPRAPRPRAQSPEAKHWCFTYNNPTMYPDEMIEELEDLGVTYAVFQLEEGKNGTPHYQGYVAFKKKKRLTAIEHLLRGAGTGKFPWARQPKIGTIVQRTSGGR